MYYLHAVGDFTKTTFHAVDPLTEASEVCGNTWHLKCHCLKRSISPWLIIRRIDAKVVAKHYVVIGHIQDAVLAVKVTRQEDEFHIILLAVVHVVVLHHSEHVVVAHLMKPMCHLRHIQWSVIFLATFKSRNQIGTWLSYPTGNFDERHYLFLKVLITKQTVHGLYIYIDTLIAELISPTCRYYQGIIVKLFSKQGVGNVKELLSCKFTLSGERGCCRRHKPILKAIRQDAVNGLVNQLTALVGCDIADGSETIHIKRCLLLYGMLALHVQLHCHLVAVIGKQIII